MPLYSYAILLIAWVAWFSAFVFRKPAAHAARTNKHARWGIALEATAFALICQGRFWLRNPGWKLAPAVLLLASAALLSWTAVTALGPHWRIDAALNPDHQLIRSGPYSLVRHPIYASMLCVLLGTGLLIAPWFLFLPAIAVFLIGTEVRVRVEDALLASQFGPEFTAYQRAVPAYIPWLR